MPIEHTEREQLIKELFGLDDGMGSHVVMSNREADAIADFILSREKALLEKIGKPLKEGAEWSKKFTYNPAVDHWKKLYKAIDDTLAIIEKQNSLSV